MITSLINPLTIEYKNFKSHVLSNQFQWYWLDNTVLNSSNDFGFYQQEILKRPEDPQAQYHQSNYLPIAYKIYGQILSYNNLPQPKPYRICVNCTHSTVTNDLSPLHTDHPYPHNNLLIYLTPTYGGETIVESVPYHGQENDVILFNGEHCMRPPNQQRRIVIVYTFPQDTEQAVEKPVEN